MSATSNRHEISISSPIAESLFIAKIAISHALKTHLYNNKSVRESLKKRIHHRRFAILTCTVNGEILTITDKRFHLSEFLTRINHVVHSRIATACRVKLPFHLFCFLQR